MLKFLAWPSVAPISQNRIWLWKQRGTIGLRNVRPFQQAQYVSHVATAVALVLAGRRNTERLATILLRQAEEVMVTAPVPVKALDDQHPVRAKSHKLGLRNLKTKGLHELHAVVLVLHTVRHIDHAV